MLRQARVFRENQAVAERVMDSNELERERGITIRPRISIPDPQTAKIVRIKIVETLGEDEWVTNAAPGSDTVSSTATCP